METNSWTKEFLPEVLLRSCFGFAYILCTTKNAPSLVGCPFSNPCHGLCHPHRTTSRYLEALSLKGSVKAEGFYIFGKSFLEGFLFERFFLLLFFGLDLFSLRNQS